MTRQYPQYQSITSPLSSREKGDWGYKRPFPLKSTMTTSTPLIRVKQVDSIENVTDFASASDHTLSLEKFQEMRVVMAVPKQQGGTMAIARTDPWRKSVFEENMDFTDFRGGKEDDRRWKFQGPWLARMTEGDFQQYLERKVRPKRAQFRQLLLERLATTMNNNAKARAQELGEEAPLPIEASKISAEQFTDYVRSLRKDRPTLYGLVSKFLDLAPLGHPVGIVQTIWTSDKAATDSPYGKSGPPPSHPSAGISYLRTNSYMESHPVYGPQERRTPVIARVLYPRTSPSPAKLGVGGFVADTPPGENEFNYREGVDRRVAQHRKILDGITYLDTTTYGGAKAFVDPRYASVDPSGKVVLQLREASPESQIIAKESQGREVVYQEGKRAAPKQQNTGHDSWRSERVTREILGDASQEQRQPQGKHVVGSSSTYGLDGPQ